MYLKHSINQASRLRQNSNCVVMVPPKEFQFNQQTAEDNEFQIPVSLNKKQVQAAVMTEFKAMVVGLRSQGIQVVELDYKLAESITPDAVFPNNWFNTQVVGTLTTFPMACSNRQSEVRTDELISALGQAGRTVKQLNSMTHLIEQERYLESTGVMVMDHLNKTIYAAVSHRCNRQALEEYAQQVGYPHIIAFDTELPSGASVYHTNVMMSVGERFAVICDEVIPEFERRLVVKNLAKSKQVISISRDQMSQFCGNVLQLENQRGDKFIALSQTAYRAFTSGQRAQLATHGQLLPFDVSMIETIGGGSVRCMLAEIFF